MTTSEKVAYLKGLTEGLGLEEDKKETKVIKTIIDVLDDMAMALEDVEGNVDLLSEQIDAVDEDLDLLESAVYDDEDDCDCGCCDDDCGDEDMYEVECPSCGETIYLDESLIEEGSVQCPACGEELEFDLEDEEGDEE